MPDTTKPNTTEPTLEDLAIVAIHAVRDSIVRIERISATVFTRLDVLAARIATSKENKK